MLIPNKTQTITYLKKIIEENGPVLTLMTQRCNGDLVGVLSVHLIPYLFFMGEGCADELRMAKSVEKVRAAVRKGATIVPEGVSVAFWRSTDGVLTQNEFGHGMPCYLRIDLEAYVRRLEAAKTDADGYFSDASARLGMLVSGYQMVFGLTEAIPLYEPFDLMAGMVMDCPAVKAYAMFYDANFESAAVKEKVNAFDAGNADIYTSVAEKVVMHLALSPRSPLKNFIRRHKPGDHSRAFLDASFLRSLIADALKGSKRPKSPLYGKIDSLVADADRVSVVIEDYLSAWEACWPDAWVDVFYHGKYHSKTVLTKRMGFRVIFAVFPHILAICYERYGECNQDNIQKVMEQAFFENGLPKTVQPWIADNTKAEQKVPLDWSSAHFGLMGCGSGLNQLSKDLVSIIDSTVLQ